MKTERVANNPQTSAVTYLVPPPVLNRFSGSFDPVPHSDEIYPVPRDWLKANASRYYFTDQQLIDAAVPEFDDSTAAEFTGCCGLYFLMLDRQIVYVGISTDMDKRICQHVKAGMLFDSLTWFEAPTMYLKELEAYYIKRIAPPFNTFKPITYFFGNFVKDLNRI